MYILRIVIFSLDEPNLTRILTVFKENLVKYKGKRTSREYTFIFFLFLKKFLVRHYVKFKFKYQVPNNKNETLRICYLELS